MPRYTNRERGIWKWIFTTDHHFLFTCFIGYSLARCSSFSLQRPRTQTFSSKSPFFISVGLLNFLFAFFSLLQIIFFFLLSKIFCKQTLKNFHICWYSWRERLHERKKITNGRIIERNGKNYNYYYLSLRRRHEMTKCLTMHAVRCLPCAIFGALWRCRQVAISGA